MPEYRALDGAHLLDVDALYSAHLLNVDALYSAHCLDVDALYSAHGNRDPVDDEVRLVAVEIDRFDDTRRADSAIDAFPVGIACVDG